MPAKTLRAQLAHAMEDGSLHFVYQPILHNLIGSIQALEALVRWIHPERGGLKGAKVVDLVERFHLIHGFAWWCLRHIVRQGRQWQRMGLILVPISINRSVEQFLDAYLAEYCAELVREDVKPVASLICSVAKALNIPVIATCVEAPEMLREIRRRGFDLVQGHVVAPSLLVGVVPD